MKRIFMLLVASMLVTGALAQNNNLFWTMHVKVKMDKKLEWEKKAPLLMKTHYPQFNFRVYEVMTGSNTGSYVISVGPISYKDLDAPPVFPKGEASAKSDGQALDAISESLEVTHYRRVEGISDIKADRKNKYARLNFVEITVGAWEEVHTFLARIKTAREMNDAKIDISYFRPVNSGAVNKFAIVYYLEKMEELDMDGNIEEMYDKAHGNNAWYKDLRNYLSMVKSTENELWALRTDLSTSQSVAVLSN